MITTTQAFTQTANGTIRPIAQNTLISFSKQRSQSMGWFVLDQSELDGGDILATEPDDVIQLWDAYEWGTFTDDVIKMDWSRSVQFPFNVQSATCDVSFNNAHQKFTYENSASPLYGQILPERPIRTYAGFTSGGLTETVPVFVGLTQGMPKYSGQDNSTATFTAMDFLSEIAKTQLGQTIMMRNARTDEVIATILDTYGLDSAMYSLDKGLNTIPFVVFESGSNAGNILSKLVQAENGSLWLDEKGIIRFSPRVADLGKLPVAQFDETNIIEIAPSQTDGIVNRVKITSDIRQVQDSQPVFAVSNENGYQGSASDDEYRISANGNADVWISFENPMWQANGTPVLNGASTDSNFTAVDLSGATVSSGLTVSSSLFSDSMKLTFTNANNFPVSITYLEIWGQPAKIVDSIKYDAYDEDSVDKFGEMILEITDNNYFGSFQNADEYAEDILRRRKDYSPTMTMKVKGNPALQLGDIIQVNHKYKGAYKIIGIKSSISNSGGLQVELTVEKFEILMPFILDESILDGTDVLGG